MTRPQTPLERKGGGGLQQSPLAPTPQQSQLPMLASGTRSSPGVLPAAANATARAFMFGVGSCGPHRKSELPTFRRARARCLLH